VEEVAGVGWLERSINHSGAGADSSRKLRQAAASTRDARDNRHASAIFAFSLKSLISDYVQICGPFQANKGEIRSGRGGGLERGSCWSFGDFYFDIDTFSAPVQGLLAPKAIIYLLAFPSQQQSLVSAVLFRPGNDFGIINPRQKGKQTQAKT
jgi:hypothetical protein